MPGVAEAVRPVVERIDRRAPGARDFGLRFWDGSEVPPPPTADDELTLVVRDPVALAYALRQPNELGFGRAWVTGALDVDGDLERGLGAARALPRPAALGAPTGWRRCAPWRAWARCACAARRCRPREAPLGRGRRHSLARDRVAVRHHYDVSNDFYRLVLGPTMVYSCAYFTAPDDTLEAAQTRKLETICRKLRLRAGERLLDIGCGWGSLVLHAAREHGARAVGRHAVRAAGRAGPRARPRRRPEPTAARSASPTTARSTTVPTTRSPASGCTSTSGGAARRVRRGVRRAAARGRPVPQPRHRPGPAAAVGQAQLHRALRLPRRRAAPGGRRGRARWSRPASRSATTSRCASTTRSRCAAGWPTSPPTATRRSPRPAPSASASGAST